LKFIVCTQGHLKTLANTIHVNVGGYYKPKCRVCHNEKMRKKYMRKPTKRIRKYTHIYNRNYCDNAAKSYVAHLLGIATAQLTTELYAFKKEQLLLRRSVLKLNKTIKEIIEVQNA